MFRKQKKPPVFHTPVFVVDALGVSQSIETKDEAGLVSLADRLEANYLRFRRTIPHQLVVTWGEKVWGTKEFNTFRLNDMFIVYAKDVVADASLRYLITARLCYQALLLDGFIPRGGLGWGLVHAGENSLIGKGFLNAYAAAEERGSATKDICAIKVSQEFFNAIPPTRHCYRLLCFYQGEFFVNPTFLHDPLLGEFDNQRIMELLTAAGVNETKFRATKEFLENFENFDAALKPDSASRTSFKGGDIPVHAQTDTT